MLENCLKAYFISFRHMQDNILLVLKNYHELIKQKMDCDSGDLLSCSPQAFINSIFEALNRIDEMETQLQGLESWIQLPVATNVHLSDNLDRVSDDAHRLVEMLQQFQSALRSAVLRNPEANASQNTKETELTDYYDQEMKQDPRFPRQGYLPQQTQHTRMYQGGFPEISDVGSFMHDTGDLMLPGNGGPVPLSALTPSIPSGYMQSYESRGRAPETTAFGGGADIPSPYTGQQQYPSGSTCLMGRPRSESMQCTDVSQTLQQQQPPPQHNPGGYAFQPGMPGDYN